MAQELRANTETIVVVGPAVDIADGITPITTLDVATADEAELLKANTVTTASIAGATWAALTGVDGYYGLTLTTSLTDTPGPLTVAINDDSLCLPVLARFNVLSEYAWDAKYGTEGVNGGKLQGADWYGTLSAVADTTVTLPASNNIDHESRIVVRLTGGTNAEGKSRFASYSGSGEVWTVDPAWNAGSETTPSGTVTAVVTSVPNSPTTNVPIVASVVGDVGGNVVGDVQGNVGGTVGSLSSAGLAALLIAMFEQDSLSDYASSVAGSVVKEMADSAGGSTLTVEAIRTEIDDNSTQLAALIAGVIVASMSQGALADFFDSDSGSTYAGATTGSVVKEMADNAGGSALTTTAIADAVWDEATAGHTAAGTAGKAVADGALVSASAVADAVWDEVAAGHVSAGTAGALLSAINTKAASMLFSAAGNLKADVREVNGNGGLTGDGGSTPIDQA